MKILVVTLLVGACIAVGATLGVTRPWQSEAVPTPTPTPTPTMEATPTKEATPVFSMSEITGLAEQQVSSTLPFPPGTGYVGCRSAVFKPAARVWVVTCRYTTDAAGTQLVVQSNFTVSDKDGKLVK